MQALLFGVRPFGPAMVAAAAAGFTLQNRNPIPTPSVEGWRLMVAIF